MKLLDKLSNKKDYLVLSEQKTIIKLMSFISNKSKDIKKDYGSKEFKEYALTIYTGRQGSGKTISIVERLEQIKRDYPDVVIMTNFGYFGETAPLTDWEQIITCRNDSGIVFAIDEIQNEFDVYQSRNFNLEILKVITQQRKQGIKILASSQVFSRVSKPLREQCFEVVECYTWGGRWTYQKCFDADDYNAFIDSTSVDKKFFCSKEMEKEFCSN